MTADAGARDAEGFSSWRAPDPSDFNGGFGEIRYRIEDGKVRCRVETGRSRANAMDTVHGGFILSYVDQVFFVAAAALELIEIGKAVTLTQSAQFVGSGRIDRPLDAVVEIVAETGRMLFLRGLMEQDGRTIASFEGALRKLGTRAPDAS